MKEKLTTKEFSRLCLLLFAMFFGSGNLIFPPLLGNQAGNQSGLALAGFAITAVIFPVLGILAISKTQGIEKLGNRVSHRFSILYPAIVFLAIGPGIAIPRNGVLPFDMAIAPYLSHFSSLGLPRFIYTLVFFGIVFYLCLTPSKLIDRMGKVLTPTLIGLIVILFVGVLLNHPQAIAGPQAHYQAPLFTGFVEGYNTMDTLASLNFGFVMAISIKSLLIEDEKKVISYASKAGLVAGTLLFVIYGLLTYLGKITSGIYPQIENGGQILFHLTNRVFGSGGSILLILIFTLACLTTAVGLVTSVSQYFSGLFKQKLSYQHWVIIFTLISLGLANFGLNTILKFSVPILITIYPVAIVLILLALTHDFFGYQAIHYQLIVYGTLILSGLAGLESAGFHLWILSDLKKKLPLSSVGMEWILPVLLIWLCTLFIKKKDA